MADIDVMPYRSESPNLGHGGSSRASNHSRSGSSSEHSVGKHITMSANVSTIGSRPSTAHGDLDGSGSPPHDYLRPIINVANRRWKLERESTMMDQIVRIKLEKKEANRAMKLKAQETARKIPMELLGRDWLVMKRSTIETRAYLVEKILPLVVLGVEKLLMEVDARGLTHTEEPDPNFNPVNFLAQFLLRNNPKYSNFTEASPYMRSMRKVAEELRGEILSYDDSRLARLKADARRKCEEYEFEEKHRALERERRQKLLQTQFEEWGVRKTGRVEIALIITSLRSFSEITERYPEELRARVNIKVPDLHPDQMDDLLNIAQFCEFILNHTSDIGSDIFDQLVEHLTKCAWAYQAAGLAAVRQELLSTLFREVDRANIGLLDRHRILALFEQFYDGAPANIASTLRNPRRWPVVQLDEEVSSDEEEEDADVKPKKRKKSTVKVSTGKEEELKENATYIPDGMNGEAVEGKNDEPATENDETRQEQEPYEDNAEAEGPGETQEGTAEETHDPEQTEGEGTAVDDAESAAADAVQDEEAEVMSEGVNDETGEVELAQSEEHENADRGSEESNPADNEPGSTEPTEKEDGVVEEPAKGVEEAAEVSAQQDSGDMLSNEQKTSAVSFAEGTVYRDTTQMSLLSRSQSVATAFDEDHLGETQFIQITETFLGEIVNPVAFQRLISFIRDGYVETEEERRARMLKVLLEQRRIQRKIMADNLFDKWDNDGSGYLEFAEFDPVFVQYKGGMEKDALKKAKSEVRAAQKHPDNRMTKKEFRHFLTSLANQMAGDDAYEYLVEFLLVTVVRTYQERVRGEARKKWLAAIRNAAVTSAASMEPIFRAVFQALFKDAETHGEGKRISAYISMLERNESKPARGSYVLRCVACTPKDAHFMLGSVLYQDMKGISFAAVEGGKPIHVPRVSGHGNVHFFNPEHNQTRDGAFVVVPLKDKADRVFGMLGQDTMGDKEIKEIFITHEIHFYQGVAKAFSVAYHIVDIRHKTMLVAESAVAWLHRRCMSCCEITFYMIELDVTDKKKKDIVLRKLLVTDENGMPRPFKDPPRLRRQDSLFRDYLFKCVDTSDSVTADAYGERHVAFPVRDKDGIAVCILDISIGKVKRLSSPEKKEMIKMLRVVQTAYQEIVRQAEEGSDLEAEEVTMMFEKLMLADLKENVRRLDARAYSELKSYFNPPIVIRCIIKAVLTIFYPEKALGGALEEWGQCKQLVGTHLGNMIMEYDPITAESIVSPSEIMAVLKDVPHGVVAKVGSKPAEHLYNWVFVCLSLLEHTRKMKSMRAPDSNDSMPGGDSLKSEPPVQKPVSEKADEHPQESAEKAIEDAELVEQKAEGSAE